MFARLPTRRLAALSPASSRSFSGGIPVTRVASVLKLNVGNEETALKLDLKMKEMTEIMREHEGFSEATRHVCKTEWAYELSFVFGNTDSWGKWADSATREKVRQPAPPPTLPLPLPARCRCRSAVPHTVAHS